MRVCRSGGPAGGPSSYRRCALGGNRGGPKEVTPSTTARMDNDKVLRELPGGRDLRIPTSANGGPRSLAAEWRATHTHTHTHTKQNQICLVEYSCVEVSGPSEVPQVVRELIFRLIQGSQACVCAIDNIVFTHTSDNLHSTKQQLLEKISKIYNLKLALRSYNSSDSLKIISSSKGRRIA